MPGTLSAVGVMDHDIRAFGRQRNRNALTDANPGTGYKRVPPFEYAHLLCPILRTACLIR